MFNKHKALKTKRDLIEDVARIKKEHKAWFTDLESIITETHKFKKIKTDPSHLILVKWAASKKIKHVGKGTTTPLKELNSALNDFKFHYEIIFEFIQDKRVDRLEKEFLKEEFTGLKQESEKVLVALDRFLRRVKAANVDRIEKALK